MKFIREFDDEKSAMIFAAEKSGKVCVRYDYKPYYGIVKKFVCTFKTI